MVNRAMGTRWWMVPESGTSSMSSLQCQVTSLMAKTPGTRVSAMVSPRYFQLKGQGQKSNLAGRQIGKEASGKQPDGKLLASSSPRIKNHPHLDGDALLADWGIL